MANNKQQSEVNRGIQNVQKLYTIVADPGPNPLGAGMRLSVTDVGYMLTFCSFNAGTILDKNGERFKVVSDVTDEPQALIKIAPV